MKKNGKGKYQISFWIKNDGSKSIIKTETVRGKAGDRKLIEVNDQLNEWQLFESVINVGQDQELRMELSILQPGTLWIDDVRVEKIGLTQ